jgi:hypothetical protein
LQTAPGLRKIKVDLGQNKPQSYRFESGVPLGSKFDVEGEFQGISMDINLGFTKFQQP